MTNAPSRPAPWEKTLPRPSLVNTWCLCHGTSLCTGWKWSNLMWKWKSEMNIIWWISIKNNVVSCKISMKRPKANFSVFARGSQQCWLSTSGALCWTPHELWMPNLQSIPMLTGIHKQKFPSVQSEHGLEKVHTGLTKQTWSPQSVLGTKQVCGPVLTKPSWHLVLGAHKAKSLLSGLTGHALWMPYSQCSETQSKNFLFTYLCSPLNLFKNFHVFPWFSSASSIRILCSRFCLSLSCWLGQRSRLWQKEKPHLTWPGYF